MTGAYDDLLFGVRRSIRYHSRRRQFFDRLNLFVQAIALIFGSATIGFVLTKLPELWAISAAAIVTVLSAVNLVVGSTRMARLHNDLARRFFELEREMVLVPTPSDPEVRKWTAERLTIEAEEPPILRVLDCLCHNELLRAMGVPAAQRARIGPVQRFFAQFCDIGDHAIKIGQ